MIAGGASGVRKSLGPAVRLPTVQTKLTVGTPGDRYEQEADHVADRVSSGRSAGEISRIPAGGLKAQRQAEGGGGEEEAAQTLAVQREPEDRGEKEAEPAAQAAPEREHEAQARSEPPDEGDAQAKCAACEKEERAQREEEGGPEEPAQKQAEGAAGEEPAQSKEKEEAPVQRQPEGGDESAQAEGGEEESDTSAEEDAEAPAASSAAECGPAGGGETGEGGAEERGSGGRDSRFGAGKECGEGGGEAGGGEAETEGAAGGAGGSGGCGGAAAPQAEGGEAGAGPAAGPPQAEGRPPAPNIPGPPACAEEKLDQPAKEKDESSEQEGGGAQPEAGARHEACKTAQTKAEDGASAQPRPEEEPAQTRSHPGQPRRIQTATAARHMRSRGTGEPLVPSVRERIESTLGVELGGVRVHTDGNAQAAAKALRAKAFTHRNHVFLGPGQSQHDVGLMAHETTHVLQQDAVIRRKPVGGDVSIGAGRYAQGTGYGRRLSAGEPAGKDRPDHGPADAEDATPQSPATEAKQATGTALPDPESSAGGSDFPEDDAGRRSEYTVTGKTAYLRDAPDSSAGAIRSTPVVNNSSAYLRRPDKLSQYLEAGAPAADAAAGGARMKRGRLTVPRSTAVKVLEQETDGGATYQKVQWGAYEGWIKSGNTTPIRVKIPLGTKVEKYAQKGDFLEVGWGAERGWTASRNIHVETWDPTYATRFASKDKAGLESEAPKTKRLPFERDGTLLLGTVIASHANKRDPGDLSNYLSDILPKGTPCLVLEERQSCYRVLDYAGEWDADADPPGWWTRTGNIRTFAGRVDPAAIENEKVRDYVGANQPKESAADTAISVSELKSTGRIVGHVVSGNAITRDERGAQLNERLPLGEVVIALENKTLAEGSPTRQLVKVLPLASTSEGQARWTAPANIRFLGSEAGYAVEQADGRLELVMRMKQAARENDRYRIAPFTAKVLETTYLESAARVLSGKTHTESQQRLLEEARAFVANNEQEKVDLPELEIPPSAIHDPHGVDDGTRLNRDLIRRVRMFYKFLMHRKLISGPPTSIGGIRARTVAHELSTKWTLNPQSGHLKAAEKRVLFARRLASLGRAPDKSNIFYLPVERIDALIEAIRLIDNPAGYRTSWLFGATVDGNKRVIDAGPLEWLGMILSLLVTPSATKREPEPNETGRESAAQDEASKRVHALIEELVDICQSRATHVGNGRAQNAQAAEGYPKSEKEGDRRPNTNDVTGISNHCGGEAIDVAFPFVFNYYDPIIDAIALYFGLYRPVKDSARSPEYWHYERVGTAIAGRTEVEPTLENGR